jgi:dihydroneopterin aldolase
MDSIIARGLTFMACHGIEPQEKTTPQPFNVDLEMFLDLSQAGQSDNLQDTVNYAEAYRLVEETVTGRSFDLIEALAEEIARVVLDEFPAVKSAEVAVYKPQAPVRGSFTYFAVKIRRCQK